MSNSVNMERRRPKGSSIGDDIAMVKAAAWAWFQRGSGSEGKPMQESDISRIHRSPQPSRFKLEAIKMIQKDKDVPRKSNDTNSLLDAYEIGRISKHLESLIESTSGEEIKSRFSGRQIVMSPPTASVDSEMVEKKDREKKSKRVRWFGLRHGIVCGVSKEDVAERGVQDHHHRRRPEKRMPVVGLANHRTRATRG